MIHMSTGYVSIQENLAKLYTKWKSYEKNERQGYQTFLSDFFACFGITFDDPNKLPFEENTGKGFADAFIKDTVIFEMKDRNKVKSKKDLEAVLPQALKYWEGKGKHVPFLVLCNFSEFIVFDTRDQSSHHIRLAELETRVDSFALLLKLNPTFVPEQEGVTRKSAKLMGALYQSLRTRLKKQNDEVDLFVLQCLFCLFSEDIGYLPAQTFTSCVRRIKEGEDNSANILSTLFKMMDEKDSHRKKGRFENVRYFNGPLFRIKPEIVLLDEEIDLLWESCQLDWKNVRPEIFGALFESSQTKKDRHKDGMHFTSEDDIMKVIKPCILDPWNEVVSSCKTLSDFREAHKKLKSYRVLDPACGSGNFLVVAYRELKALEAKIFMEYKRLSGESYAHAQEALEWFPVTNMYGIEVNPFPSFLTRVSLWITKKLVRNQYKLTEPDLPLEELKHIIAADALEVKWDDVDVVVGNPPFIGCMQIRGARGDQYFNWLGERFKNHSKMSDYCTYWYEKVLEDVRPGVRVGLVSTKSISQTNSRVASLDKIVESGGEIFNAISREKWSGEAKVSVSIVNFVNRGKFEGQKILDGKVVEHISSRLLSFAPRVEVGPLAANENLCFVGVSPNGDGFVLDKEERARLIRADGANAKVIRPYLSGEDINQNTEPMPSRWIIDFQDWSLEQCEQFRAPLKRVRDTVKPLRDKNRREKYRKIWWRFQEERMGLREGITKCKRFVCASRVSKYPIFIFVHDTKTLVSDATIAILFEDYGHLGVLQSRFHTEWYSYQCSILRGDLRYTNKTVFETFPFPENISKDVAHVMEQIEAYRLKACKEKDIGLTTLYNQLREGGHETLSKLHRKLDEAVANCYGFPKSKLSSAKDIIAFLTDRNLKLSVSQKIKGTIEKGKRKGARRKVA